MKLNEWYQFSTENDLTGQFRECSEAGVIDQPRPVNQLEDGKRYQVRSINGAKDYIVLATNNSVNLVGGGHKM